MTELYKTRRTSNFLPVATCQTLERQQLPWLHTELEVELSGVRLSGCCLVSNRIRFGVVFLWVFRFFYIIYVHEFNVLAVAIIKSNWLFIAYGVLSLFLLMLVRKPKQSELDQQIGSS